MLEGLVLMTALLLAVGLSQITDRDGHEIQVFDARPAWNSRGEAVEVLAFDIVRRSDGKSVRVGRYRTDGELLAAGATPDSIAGLRPPEPRLTLGYRLLLGCRDVWKELKFSSDDKARVPLVVDEFLPLDREWEAKHAGLSREQTIAALERYRERQLAILKEAFNEGRANRLQQMKMQFRGVAWHLCNPHVRRSIGLSAPEFRRLGLEQGKWDRLHDPTKAVAAFFDQPPGTQAKLRAEFEAGSDKRLVELMPDDVRKKWEALIGKPASLPKIRGSEFTY